MIIVHCALPGEAKPLIAHFGLTLHRHLLPLKVYGGSEFLLLISGIGAAKTGQTLNRLFEKLGAEAALSAAVNFGICGARPNIPVGELVQVKTVREPDQSPGAPCALLSTQLRPAELLTSSEPVTQSSAPAGDWELVDMEGAAFFECAGRFLPHDRIFSIKLVADHLDPQGINRDGVSKLIGARIGEIEAALGRLALFPSF